MIATHTVASIQSAHKNDNRAYLKHNMFAKTNQLIREPTVRNLLYQYQQYKSTITYTHFVTLRIWKITKTIRNMYEKITETIF